MIIPARLDQQGSPARVVFDTNVLLSLWVFDDSRFSPLRAMIDQGEWLALTGDLCLAEFKRVLGYPQFALSEERQAEIYLSYASITQRCDEKPMLPPLPRCSDRDDQKFLELARHANAGWLVTTDKALLKMARRSKLAGLFYIVTPDVVLAGLEASAAMAA